MSTNQNQTKGLQGEMPWLLITWNWGEWNEGDPMHSKVTHESLHDAFSGANAKRISLWEMWKVNCEVERGNLFQDEDIVERHCCTIPGTKSYGEYVDLYGADASYFAWRLTHVAFEGPTVKCASPQ